MYWAVVSLETLGLNQMLLYWCPSWKLVIVGYSFCFLIRFSVYLQFLVLRIDLVFFSFLIQLLMKRKTDYTRNSTKLKINSKTNHLPKNFSTALCQQVHLKIRRLVWKEHLIFHFHTLSFPHLYPLPYSPSSLKRLTLIEYFSS